MNTPTFEIAAACDGLRFDSVFGAALKSPKDPKLLVSFASRVPARSPPHDSPAKAFWDAVEDTSKWLWT